MVLDDDARRTVAAIEHKVRHLLGLYDGLARHLLNEIPDSEVELRRLVGLHATRVPEMTACLEDLFKQLEAGGPREG